MFCARLEKTTIQRRVVYRSEDVHALGDEHLRNPDGGGASPVMPILACRFSVVGPGRASVVARGVRRYSRTTGTKFKRDKILLVESAIRLVTRSGGVKAPAGFRQRSEHAARIA